MVLKTSSITTAANVKLEYEIELVLSLIFCTYLMRPIRSKLCALSYVLIYNWVCLRFCGYKHDMRPCSVFIWFLPARVSDGWADTAQYALRAPSLIVINLAKWARNGQQIQMLAKHLVVQRDAGVKYVLQ